VLVNVLAVGAHPDDIEAGCAGTLALHKAKGDKVYFLVLTRGEVSGDPQVKEIACKKSAELLGAADLFFGGLKDTMIPDGIETIRVIERIVDRVNPDIVYAHTFKDIHQDHRRSAYATLSAARNCKRILMYETPNTLKDFSPQVFTDIGMTFESKKEVLHLFANESRRFWLAAKAIEGLAVFRGFQAGVRVAEAFEVGRFVLEV
jgi:LmbE family N-acetylglucosaminyl deacetylase